MWIETVMSRIDYIITVILFCIGLYALIIKPNLIKKLIGMNVIETSVYLFFIASADVRLGPASWQWAGPSEIADAAQAARAAAGQVALVNPVPSALILTAIVVSISVTAISLALSIKIYEHYGTLDTRKIMRLKG